MGLTVYVLMFHRYNFFLKCLSCDNDGCIMRYCDNDGCIMRYLHKVGLYIVLCRSAFSGIPKYSDININL